MGNTTPPKTTHAGSQPPPLTPYQVANGYAWEHDQNNHRFWRLKKQSSAASKIA